MVNVVGFDAGTVGAGVADDGAGFTVADRYRTEGDDPFGGGGMAVVYRARDLRKRREVVLKTLRDDVADDDARARFRREVRAMQRAAHRNVAQVYDFRSERGRDWAIIEYVPGQTLKELIAQRGPLPPREVVPLLDQAAAALARLHGRGLVHLDVKPQNLVLRPDGVLKLIDFGLAQPAGKTQERIGGNTFGTVAYLAPERADGKAVSAATDVYALGCVVYELLTGRPPFAGNGAGDAKDRVIRDHRERAPVPPSQVRRELAAFPGIDGVVLRALAKGPEDRYADVAEFARAFAAAASAPTATQRTTDRLPTVPEATSHGAGAARRVAAACYRAGGRLARRAHRGRVESLVWRLALVLLLGNALLFGLLHVQRGVAASWLWGEPALRPGAAAVVSVDRANLRDGPGLGYARLTQLAAGTRVTLTGPSAAADGYVWWPITAQTPAGPFSGYIFQGGLTPAGRAGPLAAARRQLERGRDALDSAVHWASKVARSQ